LGVCQVSTPQWVDDIGGSGMTANSIPCAVKADKQNNVYVSGIYSGTVDFDPSAGVFNLTAVGGFDTYVAKYTSAGKLIWAVSVGGTGTDQANTMTLDNNGNPTVCGQFDADMDADPGAGVTTLHNKGATDAFVIRFDTNGNLSWANSIGGTNSDYGDKVASDSNGNIIQCIQYESTVTVGTQTFTSGGGSFNGLIIKYDITGKVLWAVNLKDMGDTEARYSSIDENDNIIISGEFSGNVNFNPLGTAFNLNGNGGSTFLAKYSPAGNLIWVDQINGVVVNNNSNLCTTSTGDIYIDGPFTSTLDFGGGNTLNRVGLQDVFVAKYNSNGVFQLAKDIGGASASIYNYGIEASQDNNIYISGYFTGTIDFDPSPTAKALVAYHGKMDLFLVKFDGNINYKWAFGEGNNSCSNTLGRNVAVDNNNDVLLVGSFCSTVNFDASNCTTYNLTAQSPRDSFVGKYVQSQATAASQITAISLPQQSFPAVIDQTNLKIILTVPQGTNITALVPQITVTGGTTISPAPGGAQNFTAPVTYTLTSGCTSLNYSVSVVFSTINTITACANSIAELTGDATAPPPGSYLWQVLLNGVWTDANGTNNTANYSTDALSNTTNANIVYSYRQQINTSGNIVDDSFFNITVSPLVTNSITAPATTTFCLNGDPDVITGSAPTGGNGTYTYQWQSSTDDVTFADMPGVTSANYDPPVLYATTYYRRTVVSGTCSTFSNAVTIQVLTPILNNVITTSSAVAFCSIPGTVPSGGTGTFSYQWQSSVDGVNFVNIPGAISQEYDPPPSNVTTYYRRIAISGSCIAPVTSNIVSVQVQSVVANNTITAPATVVFCSTGDPGVATGSDPSGGNGTYTYQWQSSTDNITFADISGATTRDYDPPAINASTYYRRTVVSGVCLTPSISNVINIQIQPALSGNVITALAATSFCISGNPGIISGNIPAGGNSTYTYQWQNSADGITFTNITGATAKDYDPPVINATTYYQRLTTSGTCSTPLNSNIISIQILTALANNTVTAPAITHFCTVGDPANINGNTPMGGNGSYTYQWQSSTDGVTFADIPGATATNYDPPIISATTWYRRTAISGACTVPLNSNVIVMIKDAMPVANAGSDATICIGSSMVLASSGGTAYQWSPATGLSNINTANPAASPTVTTTYTVTVSNISCSTTASVTVNVIQKPTADAGSDQKILKGQTAQLNGVVTGNNIQYHWSPASYLNNPNSLNPVATPPEDITYTLTAISANGCFIVSDDVFIKVFPQVVVPNTFTPNADGINDTWDIPALSAYPNSVVSVFNRYGISVFRSIGYLKTWTGEYNSKPVPSGTYYYTIDLKDGSKIISGWVAVIR